MRNNAHILILLATQYINKNCSKKISIAALVKHTGYSVRSIQLNFSKHFGVTQTEYIKEVRMLRVFALIKKNKLNRTIAEMAKEVGFTHAGRFSVDFKKRFGITPKDHARN